MMAKYSPELFSRICEEIAAGKTVRAALIAAEGPSWEGFRKWLQKPELVAQYAHAMELRAEAMAEELIEIADDGANDWMESNHPDNPGYKANGEHQARSRLRVDTRKWLMSKMYPKKYGDKIEQTHQGNVNINWALPKPAIEP